MRKLTTIDSTDVQGEGSFVIMRPLTVGDVREAQAAGDDLDANLRLVASFIFDWNWTDDFDKPLPLPKDDPDVMNRLTIDESEFLGTLLTDMAERRKN